MRMFTPSRSEARRPMRPRTPRSSATPFAWPLVAVVVIVVGCQAATLPADQRPAEAETPPPQEPDADRVEFPGIRIDLQRQCVDVEATVCLDRGSLELIACTRGTKEHESILVVEARPKQIHLGLLLIGARNGKPAMHRVVDGDGPSPRWIDIPPSGDPIGVWLVFEDETGRVVEHPISDFVTRTQSARERETTDDDADPEAPFPDTFVFAGSHVVTDDQGEARYLADTHGNVISISTFGDEVLCLPGWYSQDNEALAWQVDPAKLPEVGSKVTLRLRAKTNGKATVED